MIKKIRSEVSSDEVNISVTPSRDTSRNRGTVFTLILNKKIFVSRDRAVLIYNTIVYPYTRGLKTVKVLYFYSSSIAQPLWHPSKADSAARIASCRAA